MEHQFRKNELLRIRDVDSSTSVSSVSIQLLEGGGYQFDVTCMGYQDAQPLSLDDVVVVKNSDRTGLLVERHHDGSRYYLFRNLPFTVQ